MHIVERAGCQRTGASPLLPFVECGGREHPCIRSEAWQQQEHYLDKKWGENGKRIMRQEPSALVWGPQYNEKPTRLALASAGATRRVEHLYAPTNQVLPIKVHTETGSRAGKSAFQKLETTHAIPPVPTRCFRANTRNVTPKQSHIASLSISLDTWQMLDIAFLCSILMHCLPVSLKLF